MLQTFRKTACSIYEPLQQANVLALLNPNSGAYAMLAPLSLSSWRILSFDSANALVCIQLDAPSGSRIINITLDIASIENSRPFQARQFEINKPTGQYI